MITAHQLIKEWKKALESDITSSNYLNNKIMKNYSIPIVWESYKRYEVEAENLQEAVTKALRIFLKEPDDEYIDDSVSIDDLISEDYQEEDFDIHKAMQDL